MERSIPSARQTELLEAAYRYALTRGLADLSLRPLAAAIGTSPRVLLYLFGSKDGLIRALLARARASELDVLEHIQADNRDGSDQLRKAAGQVWAWLAATEHRALLALWVEGYARSLFEDTSPWAGFARDTVRDWLALLALAQPPHQRDSPAAVAQRTAVLAVLRGAMLDLLATGDHARTTAAVETQLAQLGHGAAQEPPT